MPTQEKIWDRHSIKAEVERRGMTLTGIAKDAKLYESACRQGLMGVSKPGANAIAKALGIPFETLFAGLYKRGHNSKANVSLKSASESRQNSTNVVDGRAA
jgi:Ner family transcriptional regulator